MFSSCQTLKQVQCPVGLMTAGSGASLFWLMKIKQTEVKEKTILYEKEIQ